MKLETEHHPHWLSSSPLWRKRLSRNSPNTPLLFALVTSDWPRARKFNNPTTIKHMTFFHFLIPYQHVYTNPVISTFYIFVFNTIVKIFTWLRVLWFCSFLATIRWYNIQGFTGAPKKSKGEKGSFTFSRSGAWATPFEAKERSFCAPRSSLPNYLNFFFFFEKH